MKCSALLPMAALVLLVAEASARAADPGASAMAESLFDQGRALLDQGKTEQACDKFAASRKLENAPGTTLNLADCYARLGRTATAWVTFVDAESDARREHDDFREREAGGRARSLEPTLSRLRLHFASRPAAPQVAIDGAIIPADVAETWMPVDPGARRVEVSAPGFSPRVITVAIPNGPSETTAEVSPLVALASEPPVRPPPLGPPPLVEPPPERVPYWSTLRVTSVITAGAAVACAGVGLGLGAMASSKWNDAQNKCPSSSCGDASARSSEQTAGSLADVSTGLFIGAGVLLVTATTLWILAPKSTSASIHSALTSNGFVAHF